MLSKTKFSVSHTDRYFFNYIVLHSTFFLIHIGKGRSHYKIGYNSGEQVWIYYGSGTDGCCCTCTRQMLSMHSPDGSTFLHQMSWHVECYEVLIKIGLRQPMRKNNFAKFSSWSNLKSLSLKLFWRGCPIKKRRTRWVAIWDQFLIQKVKVSVDKTLAVNCTMTLLLQPNNSWAQNNNRTDILNNSVLC